MSVPAWAIAVVLAALAPLGVRALTWIVTRDVKERTRAVLRDLERPPKDT